MPDRDPKSGPLMMLWAAIMVAVVVTVAYITIRIFAGWS
jgi:hypothetical protein